MMLLKNIGLFFAVYLPLSFLIGLPLGFYESESIGDSTAYSFFVWFLVAVQLFIPSLIVFIVLHFVLVLGLVRVIPNHLGIAAIVLTPLVLLAAHGGIWLPASMTYQVLLVDALPAAILGAVMRLPDPDQ